MPDTHFYRYDDYDRTLVAERVEQFRDQVRRRLAGELTEEQFKPLRLTNGLYLQLHAYMLRIAIPYGTLSVAQLRKLAEIARKYDRGYGHFTTRQNLQLNWIKLEDAPDAIACPGRSRHARHADVGQRDPQRHRRSLRRRGGRRDRGSAHLVRDRAASGRRCIPSSASCRASSRSPSPARPTTAPPCGCTTSAAAVAQRRGRGRLRGDRGRRARPHADDRQDAARVPAADELLAYLEATCASTTATAGATISTRRA
jgi:hypothetical protein